MTVSLYLKFVIKMNFILNPKYKVHFRVIIVTNAAWPFLGLTQRSGVPHVERTGPSDVGTLQEEVGEAVQAQAGGQGADQTVQPPQENAQGPTDEQEDHQPHQCPQARGHVGHLGVLRLGVLLRLRWRGLSVFVLGQTGKCRVLERWNVSSFFSILFCRGRKTGQLANSLG